MAQFGPIGLSEGMEDLAYKLSFGSLPNRTVYKHYPPKGESKPIDLAKDFGDKDKQEDVEVEDVPDEGAEERLEVFKDFFDTLDMEDIDSSEGDED